MPGVEAVEVTGAASVRFTLTGPPGDALQVLAAADVVSLAVREPSLEEIFLGDYGGEQR
ncbi:DUF4162 domain-containing protein [Streptomyces sp. NBC_01214]|uniref:hypothetical protein n=1 Tax=Streptomyces sp. NBC_01214 TaxID=2903777 RepID=UPI0022500E9A|nr:hypothetical protein [Streptomyces sp. NBC_01214]MCX4807615.1 DUF4162 domain-containing protein [Streptomyces sp. NBC_01214]